MRVFVTLVSVLALLALVVFLSKLKPEVGHHEYLGPREPERFYVKCESNQLMTCVVYDKETKKSYVYAGSYREGAGLVEIK